MLEHLQRRAGVEEALQLHDLRAGFVSRHVDRADGLVAFLLNRHADLLEEACHMTDEVERFGALLGQRTRRLGFGRGAWRRSLGRHDLGRGRRGRLGVFGGPERWRRMMLVLVAFTLL